MEKSQWYLWMDGDASPFLNMAVDELLLPEMASAGIPLLRIYGWDRPSISIGYVQDYNAAGGGGYAVVRRPTGGGVVFHDRDLTYTVVIPPEHQVCSLDRVESYHVFHRAVLRAMRCFGVAGELAPDQATAVDRATMRCFSTPTRYDVIGDGRKYAGAAQRRGRDGILHQGSISLELSGGDRAALSEALVAAMAEEFGISFEKFVPGDTLLKKAGELAAEKYATTAWNVDRTWRKGD